MSLKRGFKVWTFNVNGQDGWNREKWNWFKMWRRRAPLVAGVIADSQPEIVLFQEAGVTIRSTVLTHLPEYDYYLGKRAGKGPNPNAIYINTIIWKRDRFRCIAKGTFWLTEDGSYGKGFDGQERSCSWVLLEEVETGERVYVYNPHLDNIGKVARREGMKIILADIAKRAGTPPVIIGADFNTSTWYLNTFKEYFLPEPYELMETAGFRDTWKAIHGDQTREFTFHNYLGEGIAEDPDKFNVLDPDHIFASAGLAIHDARIIKDHCGKMYPSDHYPVEAAFSFTEQSA